MFAEYKSITGQDSFVGYFDGLTSKNTLRGWAFSNTAPTEELEIRLFIHGIHMATTFATLPRVDVDKAYKLAPAANAGYEFLMQTFEPAGALEFLRRFGHDLTPIQIDRDVRVGIAGGLVLLPTKSTQILDLESFFPEILWAAATQLRHELQNGPADTLLGAMDKDILLQSNPLFHEGWYADTFAEIAETNLTPAQHFLFFAKDLERPASSWFDTEAYLDAAPDVREALLPAILHYDLHGHDIWWPGQGKFRDSRPDSEGNGDHAVLIHLFHPDTVPDLQWMLRSFSPDVDVFITIPEGSPDHDPDVIAKLFPQAREILTVPNRGQDIGAFLHAVRHLKGRGYRFFCKAHSGQKGPYPELRRRMALDALAATPSRVDQIVSLFRADPRILMAGPAEFWFHGPTLLTRNEKALCAILDRLRLGQSALRRDWAFFSETCFWIDSALAELVADITGSQVTSDDTNNDTIEDESTICIFGLISAALSGRIALVDGGDWASAPKLAGGTDYITPDKDVRVDTWLPRYLKSLSLAKIVPGTSVATDTATAKGQDMFQNVDPSLHGSIDVMVSCWIGEPELPHTCLASLGHALEQQGLTCAFLVRSKSVADVFHTLSCQNVFVDSLYLRFGQEALDVVVPIQDIALARDTALSWLRSEALFNKKPLPENSELEAALDNVRRIYAYWRTTLIRRKVKLFLIWGMTAPKSRMFMHLCQDLGIEYQFIERGHFPGTLSIDPMGQFGEGVIPRLVQHLTQPPVTDLDARFDAIRTWYQDQSRNAAYAKFQRRDTRDIGAMKQARSFGRPIILVIGGNDQGAGVVGPDPDPLRVNWFGTSDQAFSMIRRVVSQKFPNALLVLRPHPSQAPQEADFVLVARDSVLDDLVDEADLCISICSTSRAVCLLKEKPLLTLGLSELNGSDVGVAIKDATHLLSALRHAVWSDFKSPYPDAQNRRLIVDLFDKHLVGLDASIPTRHQIPHLAQLIAGRIQRMKTGYLQEYNGREDQISRAMFEDVRDRGRAIFPVDPRAFSGRRRPGISVVVPIYGDYEGTRICFEQLMRHQAENGYRVITVWDRGPDQRLRDLCLEYAEKAGFTYLENRENVGFSGTVNQGILEAGRDDVILLNSDTIPCGDWALRLQDAAYAHPKIASVVPFSNNATIYNIPFYAGMKFPQKNPEEWASTFDKSAKNVQPFCVEVPVSHGYCTYVRRSAYDRLGLYDEIKFGIGQSEDNEFSLRARIAGYFCVCPTNVFMAHAGSTSFGTEIDKWLQNGRAKLREEFSHYFEEISQFFKVGDPLDRFRRQIVDYETSLPIERSVQRVNENEH